MSIVLPGEQVPAQHVNLKLGPGLLQLSSEGSIVATKAGALNHSTNKSKWWIESNSRRVCIFLSLGSTSKLIYLTFFFQLLQYVPAPQESVIGIVTARSGEAYRVDIGSAHYANLDGLAFEGATKRNRPMLKASTIYA
jgi:exosome complex component RRP40